MRILDFNTLLRTAIVAGLVAAVAVALFHQVVTEPVIDSAIALEEARMAADHGTGEEPVVSRDWQRIGLMLGVPLYGLAMGVLFCIGFYLLRRIAPPLEPARLGILLGLVGYWSLALGPFLKYPANPPGIGDPETIQARVFLDLAFKALLVAAAVLSLYLARERALPAWSLVAANLLFGAVLWLVMPANTDPVEMPGDLVLQFRVLSLAGLTVLWALLTGLFAWQLRRPANPRPAGARPLPGSSLP